MYLVYRSASCKAWEVHRNEVWGRGMKKHIKRSKARKENTEHFVFLQGGSRLSGMLPSVNQQGGDREGAHCGQLKEL